MITYAVIRSRGLKRLGFHETIGEFVCAKEVSSRQPYGVRRQSGGQSQNASLSRQASNVLQGSSVGRAFLEIRLVTKAHDWLLIKSELQSLQEGF